MVQFDTFTPHIFRYIDMQFEKWVCIKCKQTNLPKTTQKLEPRD